MEQVPLHLQAVRHFSHLYFIPHSGVVQAWEYCEHCFVLAETAANSFFGIFLGGPRGSGKTHLAESYRDRNPVVTIEVWDLPHDRPAFDDDAEVARFIARYESLKAQGGVFFICSRLSPTELTANPHISSRVKMMSYFELALPREEELEPLLISLLERYNLRLSPRNLEYLLRRIPRNPLSFARISAKINALSLRLGKPVSLKLLTEVVETTDDD